MEDPIIQIAAGVTVLILCGLVMAVTQQYTLQAKFIGLGNMAGMTRARIESVVGPPQSVSAAADGKVLLQWMDREGYHICLLFDRNGLCECVTHEFKAP